MKKRPQKVQNSSLVQSIFSPPARPRASPAFAKGMLPRRRAKNALHYVHSRIMYSRPASVRQQVERSPRSSALLACVENLPRLANCA
jgi:hypothetical protein